MLTLRMAQWPEDTGLTHKSTTWQVATDSQFSNIMDESNEDEIFLDVYYSNVVVPKGEVYYGRSKRHFENGTETDWIGPVKLLPAEAGENIDIKPEVVVEAPYVKLDKDSIIDPTEQAIVLKTGSFRCANDGHLCTHWILRDGSGKALYVDMYDHVNKTELVIPKSMIDLQNVNILVLEAAHVTSNNYESEMGRTKITLNKFKFEVTSNLHSVSPIKDFELKFKLLTGQYDAYPLEKVIIRNTDHVKVFEKELKNETSIIIDRDTLKENSTYFVDFYQKGIVGEVKTIVFNTIDNKGTYAIDPKYVYKEEYSDTNMTVDNILQCSSEQFLDNGIPLPVGTNGYPGLFNYDRRINTFTLSDLPVTFIRKSVDGHAGLNFKVLDVNKILIDRRSGEDNVSEFSVYNYDSQVLLGSVERNDETVTTGLVNNLTVAGNGENVYYLAKVDDEVVLRVLRTKTMTIDTLASRPDINNLDATLVYIGDGRLMSLNGGTKHLVYIYDIKANLWTSVTYVPEKFQDLKLVSFLRKDGKVVSFNTASGTNNTLVFDHADNTIKEIQNKLDDTINLDSTIRLRNGEFLRFNSGGVNSKIYKYI